MRNKDDDADLLVVTSLSSGSNPYLAAPPRGDGQSVDPLSGRVTVGAYVGRIIDVGGDTTEEVVVHREDFGAYADTAAFLAVWNTEIDDNGGATWSLAAGERVITSAKAARVDVAGPHDPGDRNLLQRTLGGLTPGQTYKQYWKHWNEDGIPGSPTDEWFQMPTLTEVADGAGEITLEIGGTWGAPSASHTGTVYYDDLYVTTVQATTGRIVTSILTDSGGVPQVLGNRARWDVSDDGGSSWDNLVNGYLNRLTLTDGLVWEAEVGDTDRMEQQATLFAEVDRDLAEPSCLLGGPVPGGFGDQPDYGMPVFTVEAVDTSAPKFVELVYTSGPLPPHSGGFNQGPVDTDPDAGRRVVNGAAVPMAVASNTYVGNDRYWTYPGLTCALYNAATDALVGTFTPISRALGGWEEVIGALDPDGLRDRGIGKSLVASGMRFSIAWTGDGSQPAQPSVGAKYKVLLYANQISDKAPFHQSGHPVDIAASIATYLGIAYDSASATATKNTLGPDLYVELRHKATMNAAALLQVLFGAFGFAWRVDATDSEREFFVTRLRTSATPAVEITEDDLRDVGEPYDLAESSAVTRVIWKQRQFAVWSSGSDAYEDRPLDGLIEADYTVRANLAAVAASNASERVLTYEIPGRLRSLANGTADWVSDFVGGMAETIYGRWAGGNPVAALPVLGTVAAEIGDYIVAEVAHLPNAIVGQSPTSQRGGRQVVQVVQRTESPSGPLLRVIKAGPDLGDAPTPLVPTLSIAASADLPKKRAVVTVTNHTAIEGTDYSIRVEFGTGASEPDGFAVAGYLSDTAGDDELSLPAVDAGAHVWARARLERVVEGVPQIGAYSTVVDVDLTDLTAPTLLTATQQGSTTVYDLTWTVGEADQPVVVEYQQSGDSAWITLGIFPPGTESAEFVLPDPTVNWNLQVFHREAAPFAGESAADTETITGPGGAATTLDAPTSLTATVKAAWGAVEFCWLIGDDRAAATEIATATETAVGSGTFGSYSTADTVAVGFLNEGDQQCQTLLFPVDGRQRRAKVRHIRSGMTASAYTSEVTFTPGVPGTGTGGSGPASAQYVVLATHADLTAERVLVAGTALDLTDGGAGGNVTLDVDLSEAALDDLGDVDAAAPNDGDVLTWNNTDGEWQAAAATGGSGNTNTIDTFANRPGSPAAGDRFLPTDGVVEQVYTGSAWRNIVNGLPRTAPLSTGWSWVNQNNATVATEADTEFLYSGAFAGAYPQISARVRSVPTAPYVITVACIPYCYPSGTNNGGMGLCWRESGTGELVTFGLQFDIGEITLVHYKWTSPTVFSAAYAASNNTHHALNVGPVVYLRLTDDNTNRSVYFSNDGKAFQQLGTSVGRTDFLTADGVGFFVLPQVTTAVMSIRILSWEET